MSQNKPQDKLLDHDSDGIQEYDNDLPRWWLYLFYFTIAWSAVYIWFFHLSGRPTPREALEQQMVAQQNAPSSSDGESVNWAALASDEKVKTKGREVFMGKCMPCHSADGGGLVGPNLTDKHWIHGGKPNDIYKVVQNGVPEKGMLAWKNLMTKEELIGVTVHVLSLKGTKPANPKAPEGKLEE